MRMMTLATIVSLGAAGCTEETGGGIFGHDHEETEDFSVSTEEDHYSRTATHHGYEGQETYEWKNCGEAATVDVDETEPGCYTEGSTLVIDIRDAEGTLVFTSGYENSHAEKDRPTQTTDAGVPGLWKIVLTFGAETGGGFHNDSSWHGLRILIDRLGDCAHHIVVNGNNGVGNGEDPQPPGDPPINDGPGAGPGEPGNRGGPWVHWYSTQTKDRDLTESRTVSLQGSFTTVEAGWSEWTAGTLRIEVKDSQGTVVYDRTLDSSYAPPVSEMSAAGVPGTWTVTFTSTDLETKNLKVLVYTP